MFLFNLETAALNESLKTAHEAGWAGLASACCDSTTAIWQWDRSRKRSSGMSAIRECRKTSCARLCTQHTLRRIDFYSLALGMVQAVEAADLNLVKIPDPEEQEELFDERMSA